MVTHSGTVLIPRSVLVARRLPHLAALLALLLALLPALLVALRARLLRRHRFGHPGARLRLYRRPCLNRALCRCRSSNIRLLPRPLLLEPGLRLNLPGSLYRTPLDYGLAPARLVLPPARRSCRWTWGCT